MSICRIYCEEIPRSVERCDALQPQVIRIHENIPKSIRFAAIRTCQEKEQTNDYHFFIVNNNEIVNTPSETTETLPTYTYTVTNSKTGTTVQTGSGVIQFNTSFTIVVNGLAKGFYKLKIETTIKQLKSVCVFSIVVCS